MAITVASLDALASTLQVALSTAGQLQPGQSVQVTLVPDPSALQVTDAVGAPVEGIFITKDVRFGDSQLEPSLAPASLNAKILGGMPIIVPVGPPPAGVGGVIGQFTGSLPVLTDVPVSAAVVWTILDANGTTLAQNADFVAPQGLTTLAPVFVFAPATSEMTSSNPVPAPVERRIRATVTLTAAGITSNPVPLPDATVFVAALPIPTVAAFFRHGNFAATTNDDAGFVLVVVPGSSPLGNTQQLLNTLNAISAQLGTLSQIARFAAFVTGVSTLAAVTAAQTHMKFRARDEIRNLNDLEMIPGFWNDIEAEDEITSIIFVAAEGRSVECFVARNLSAREGSFTINTGPELHAMVSTLQASTPATQPPGHLVVGTPRSEFNNELSSLRFP